MAKIVNIASSENKDKNLLNIVNSISGLKASLANIIDEYEDV